jgi:hypothetical protein|tara:strand:- start:856 stop:1497 length:642 start_codon:yes stop_codon:yes gene_type:complete
MSNEILLVDDTPSNGEIVTSDAFDVIRDLHDKVSMEDTPRSFIKNKMGVDYVEVGYMKKMADKHYPGWSWTIVRTETLGSEAFMVHGRLKWFEGGIWREGDMTAAHRIMKKRGSNEFVDVGNDIKSANTDCIKKAFNMYLNIADDVYRNRVEDTSLSQEEIDFLYKQMEGLNEEWKEKISLSIEDGNIEKGDIDKVVAKIELIKKETKGKDNE